MSEKLTHRAEIIKKRYLYREKILKGKLRIPLQGARSIIGPDTAYHLYGLNSSLRGNKKTGQ